MMALLQDMLAHTRHPLVGEHEHNKLQILTDSVHLQQHIYTKLPMCLLQQHILIHALSQYQYGGFSDQLAVNWATFPLQREYNSDSD